MIRFNCPNCSTRLKVPLTLAGKVGTCPRCAAQVMVPVPTPHAPDVLPREFSRPVPVRSDVDRSRTLASAAVSRPGGVRSKNFDMTVIGAALGTFVLIAGVVIAFTLRDGPATTTTSTVASTARSDQSKTAPLKLEPRSADAAKPRVAGPVKPASLASVPGPLAKATPSQRATEAPASGTAPTPNKTFTLVQLTPSDGTLSESLRAEVAKAKEKNQTPFVEFYADWCGPCRSLRNSLNDPRMTQAFGDTYIIQLDLDKWKGKLAGTGYSPNAVPVFYKIHDDGRPAGPTISGDAWGANTPANMAPPLQAFFRAHARVPDPTPRASSPLTPPQSTVGNGAGAVQPDVASPSPAVRLFCDPSVNSDPLETALLLVHLKTKKLAASISWPLSSPIPLARIQEKYGPADAVAPLEETDYEAALTKGRFSVPSFRTKHYQGHAYGFFKALENSDKGEVERIRYEQTLPDGFVADVWRELRTTRKAVVPPREPFIEDGALWTNDDWQVRWRAVAQMRTMTVDDSKMTAKDGKWIVAVELHVTAFRFPNEEVPGAILQRAVLHCRDVAILPIKGPPIRPALLHFASTNGKWYRHREEVFGDAVSVGLVFYRPTETVRFVAIVDNKIDDLEGAKLQLFGQPTNARAESVRRDE